MTASKSVPKNWSEAKLRLPGEVMRAERFGALHQSRLSFLRSLLRELRRDHWQVERTHWVIDAKGVGSAIYVARGPQRSYSLICFGNDLDPSKRTDRVIAEEWDATFALFDGEATEHDVQRLSAIVPKQEAGRCSASELVLSRANRSVRLFDHTVERLAAGLQPDVQLVESIGYLMRTTAVYGNGKFGLCDREHIATRSEFSGPFRAEMLTVWLIRAFTADLVEHLAFLRAPGAAVRINPRLRRRFGVGNSTGLGMAPFLIKHPLLINNWMRAREIAIARVRSVPKARESEIEHFRTVLTGATKGLKNWTTEDPIQRGNLGAMIRDCDDLLVSLDERLRQDFPWDRIFHWASTNAHVESQEFINSLMLEPYGDLVDDLTDEMSADEESVFAIDGATTCHEVEQILKRDYNWALSTEFDRHEANARFWYVSEEKLEPRLGERDEEEGSELEQPLAIGRDVVQFHNAIRGEGAAALSEFLRRRPEFRHVARRVLTIAKHPYGEVRENLIGARFRPIDLLRFKLAFFGAMRFDPRSDRWLRITLYQGAPYPTQLHQDDEDENWVYQASEQ